MCLSPGLWSLAVALMCQAPTLSYNEAYELAVAKNQPLVVLVGASWCPACKQMEKELIPRLADQKFRGRVVFVKVDLDREWRIGHQLVGNGPIPQLFLFRRIGDRWRALRFIGWQDFSTVEKHITKLGEATPEDPFTQTQCSTIAPPTPPERKSGTRARVAHANVVPGDSASEANQGTNLTPGQ